MQLATRKYCSIIFQVDCTVETIKCKKWGVNSFPTLMMFKNGNQVSFGS